MTRLCIARCIRWVLSLVFIYAGTVKLFDTQSFAVVIDGYGLLPASLVLPFAVALPVLEIISAIGLFFKMRGCLGIILLQLIFFICILSYGIMLGLDVDCGCFGPDDPEQAYKGIRAALYRDFAMLAAVFYLFRHEWNKWKRQELASSIRALPQV